MLFINYDFWSTRLLRQLRADSLRAQRQGKGRSRATLWQMGAAGIALGLLLPLVLRRFKVASPRQGSGTTRSTGASLDA